MSGEKFDLAEVIDTDARDDARFVVVRRDRVLALVAAVRAARTLVYSSMDDVQTCAYFDALDAALSPFTDSAEVRSDD